MSKQSTSSAKRAKAANSKYEEPRPDVPFTPVSKAKRFMIFVERQGRSGHRPKIGRELPLGA